MNNALQAVGAACVLLFCFLVWPPLPLLVGGAGLMVWAELRQLKARAGAREPAGGDQS